MLEPVIADVLLEQRPQRSGEAHGEDRPLLLELQHELAVEAEDVELLHVRQLEVLRLEPLPVQRHLPAADEDDPPRRTDHLRNLPLEGDQPVTHHLVLLLVPAQEDLLLLLAELQLREQVNAPIQR
jgi:hypothetical protein